jgi:FkbM family methyltransferase
MRINTQYIILSTIIFKKMSTKYFLLTRQITDRSDNNTDNQIVHLNPGKRQVFMLPEVNLDYYWRRGLFECQLIEWSKQFCNSEKTFLDIGAHTGTYAISLANSAKEVVAFEPQRATYYALCGSVAASGLSTKIVCHKYGLGSEEQVGNQVLKIVSNDGGGSSLSPAENEQVIRDETVEIRTLDSFQLKGIGFVKMDVENNELNVLRGALDTLRESDYPPILFESNDRDPALFGFLKEALKYKVIQVWGVQNMYLAHKD